MNAVSEFCVCLCLQVDRADFPRRRVGSAQERMQPLLDRGNAFIAVGALHLAGERGLLCGLAARGYLLKRLY